MTTIRRVRFARTAARMAAATLAVVWLSGCALQPSLDEFLDSPGPNKTALRPAPPGENIDPGAIYSRISPSIVTVITDIDGDESAEAIGTGWAIGDGYVVTNTHVVADLSAYKRAKNVYLQLSGGQRLPAEITGTDAHADLAVLHSRALERMDIPALKVSRTEPRVGDPVVAIGSPLGETNSLSVGYVTGLDRSIPGLGGFKIEGAIQTDASITLGNSGGPLLDRRGHVIGVNDQIKSIGGGGEGLAFAIPAEKVRRSTGQLIKNGRVRYAYLGVETRPVWPELAHFLGLPDTPGVLVGDIREGSPAEAARLHGGYFDVSFQGSRLIAGGDMIISIGRQKLRPNEKLVTVLERFRPGQAVEVGFVRDGREQSLRIELGERPLIKENALGF